MTTENPESDAPLIFLVDDEPTALKMLEVVLKKHGYKFKTAGSGSEALDMLFEFAPQVVITDFQMPEMDGVDFFVKARMMRPFLRGILHSGVANYDILTRTVEAGFDDCLAKPSTPDALIASLEVSIANSARWKQRYKDLRATV